MTQMLSHFVDFLAAHQTLAILFAFLVAFGEALLILGLFVPSTTVLVGLGALIGLGKMAFLPVFLATVAGAIAGDALSFWAGVHWKERIRTFWPFSRYGSLMDKGESFIARHGGKSIFIVRFIPGVKAVVPTIAGMMGMSLTRFALVNVGSAFVWAAAHLLPAIALGRGFQVVHAANPRFAILAGLGVGAGVVAWAAMRLARGVLIPAVDRGRLGLASRLENLGYGGGGLARVLRNQDGALEAAALIGLAICALTGFGLLLAAVVFDPELAQADAAISHFVQGLRTDWATSALVGITMLGDMAVLLPTVILLIAGLAANRQWVLSATVAAASLAGTAFVPLFKTLIHRARPVAMYQGADGFSFPSGHSTLATVILGTLALIVAQVLPARFRGWVYAGTAALVALIALSRVYLLAHWPSDVLAGLLFGGALVGVVALILHARAVVMPRWVFAALLAVVGLGIMPLHIWSGWTAATARYDVTVPQTTMTAADWRASGWQDLPTHRVLLDGDPGEAMLAQTTLARDDVVNRLKVAGWQPTQTSLFDEMLWSVLPSHSAIAGHAPWPMTHLGRPALATLTKSVPDDLRQVLRIWPTDVVVQDGKGTAPLLQISISADRLDPIAFGFSLLEETVLAPDQLMAGKERLAAAMVSSSGKSAHLDLPLLVDR